MTASGAAGVTHDGRGNTNAIGTSSYTYTSDNRLATGPGFAALAYDPLGRFYYRGVGSVWQDYAGDALVTEIHHPTNSIQRRHVPGPGVDEPLVTYEGAGTSDRRFLHADERGSIVAQSDAAGAVTAVNRYDEYGQPQDGIAGRFGYTGQAWVPELGLWYYKARMYNPGPDAGGRFMQADPIGYGDGMNLYAYVGGDPVNGSDPSGTSEVYCTGSIIARASLHDCGSVNFLRINGIDAGAAQMQRENDARDLLPGASTGLIREILRCVDTPGCASMMTILEMSSDARQTGTNHCPGQYQCDDRMTRALLVQIRALTQNSTFMNAVRYVAQRTVETGNEWGFTGRGRANFRLVGAPFEGGRSWIPERLIAARAAQGADLFFHTHPNLGGRFGPSLSTGVASIFGGGDLGIAYKYSMFVVALAFSTRRFYWFDGVGLRQ